MTKFEIFEKKKGRVSKHLLLSCRLLFLHPIHTNAFSKVSVFISARTKRNIFIQTSVFISFSPIHTRMLENDETVGPGMTHDKTIRHLG